MQIPSHVWGTKLFKMIAGVLGSFVCGDEQTFSGALSYEARILIKTKIMERIDEEFQLWVDDVSFVLFAIEVTMVSVPPMRPPCNRQDEDFSSSSMEVSSKDEKDEEADTVSEKNQIGKSSQEETKETDGEKREKGNSSSGFDRTVACRFKIT